jgi:hypothetical protein
MQQLFKKMEVLQFKYQIITTTIKMSMRKINENIILKHYLDDRSIDLQEGTQPPFGPIYSLSQNKSFAFKERINKNMVKNFICHPKSLTCALVSYIKKKNG